MNYVLTTSNPKDIPVLDKLIDGSKKVEGRPYSKKYSLMPTVAPMVAAVVAGPAARLEVQGPLGGLTDHTPSKPCQLGARGGSCQVAQA